MLEAVLITRSDNGKLAFPGGFVSPGEELTETLKREFGEEALGSLEVRFYSSDLIVSRRASSIDSDSQCNPFFLVLLRHTRDQSPVRRPHKNAKASNHPSRAFSSRAKRCSRLVIYPSFPQFESCVFFLSIMTHINSELWLVSLRES